MSRVIIKNEHPVAITMTTPDENLTIPAGATAIIFAKQIAIRVTGEEAPAESTDPAAPAVTQGATS